MSPYTHPLTLQVQELFIGSELTPDVTCLFLSEINDFFVSHTIIHSDNLPLVVSRLYEIDDKEMYSVISVCGVTGYEAVLIPQMVPAMFKKIRTETIEFIKASGKYSGQELYAEIDKVGGLLNAVNRLLRDSTRTSRRAISNDISPSQEIEFPEYDALKAFYKCGRKVAYKTVIEGETNLEYGNTIYLCVHCNEYHQGKNRVSNAPVVAEEIMMGRYKTAWRRYHKI
jgi:hypothetical protein